MAKPKHSSQQLILAGLNSQRVSLSSFPTASQPADTLKSTQPFQPKIDTANKLPPGADVNVKCKGAGFKPRSITLETGIVTTLGDTLTYHRQAFGKQIRLFDYSSAIARDMRWVASLLHSAGVQHTSVTSGRVGANFTQAHLERQLHMLNINTMAVARLAKGNNTLWKNQPSATKWQRHQPDSVKDLQLPLNTIALTA